MNEFKVHFSLLKTAKNRPLRGQTLLHVHVTGQNKIQVNIILTWFDSQFRLSSNPNYS